MLPDTHQAGRRGVRHFKALESVGSLRFVYGDTLNREPGSAFQAWEQYH